MNSYIFTGFVLVLALCQIYGQDQFYGRNEAACLQQGGLCITGTECENKVESEGLCPEQQAQGFICCYGLPKSETRCRKRGGQCSKKNYCAEKLVYKEASDCAPGQECCILV